MDFYLDEDFISEKEDMRPKMDIKHPNLPKIFYDKYDSDFQFESIPIILEGLLTPQRWGLPPVQPEIPTNDDFLKLSKKKTKTLWQAI